MKFIEDGFIQRNKKIIAISFIILILSVFVGAIYTYLTIGDEYGLITEMFSNGKTNFGNEDLGLTTEGLFLHNLGADLIVVFGGLIFSIISILSVIGNGFSIGAMFGADFIFGCVSILPHGIIEYSASALALSIAFLITKLEVLIIKNRSFKEVLAGNKIILKDILVLFVIVIILLLIAAFIEANITKWVVVSYFGL